MRRETAACPSASPATWKAATAETRVIVAPAAVGDRADGATPPIGARSA